MVDEYSTFEEIYAEMVAAQKECPSKIVGIRKILTRKMELYRAAVV